MLPRIAVTLGDPAGVGPEVVRQGACRSVDRIAGPLADRRGRCPASRGGSADRPCDQTQRGP